MYCSIELHLGSGIAERETLASELPPKIECFMKLSKRSLAVLPNLPYTPFQACGVWRETAVSANAGFRSISVCSPGHGLDVVTEYCDIPQNSLILVVGN